MNDQTWNNPGAGATASGADMQSWRDWSDNTVDRVFAARNFSEALIDCDPEDRLDLLEYAHEFLRAGMPMVPFGGVMDQAAFWADIASRTELKAYCLACYTRLSPRDQRAFLAYVQGGKGA
ncbi:hypothetical protein PANO111632_21195 [Paracoccus nototheniae]|uniref:Uncharacterized protein n=1 Tax=Paracoccus nototheniae TaxID=2489002 RepID=A0ABW4DYT8_9RHOB|nr:hypothetical protein [Paracoccus nototheniae]